MGFLEIIESQNGQIYTEDPFSKVAAQMKVILSLFYKTALTILPQLVINQQL